MAKFKFKLEKLLEYRRLQEGWAKDAYAETMARKLEAEGQLEGLRRKRQEACMARPCGLDGRVSLDKYVTRLQDEERAGEATLSVLESDVEAAQQVWLEARKEAEAIQKLRDADFEQWLLEENRREQAELDEWSILRRAS
ncbi:MAG: flagellar export protein FliJ [Armatimonadetes bacterium]|nr:flagellar export protein FliJ [Armatimonadota bacterium]